MWEAPTEATTRQHRQFVLSSYPWWMGGSHWRSFNGRCLKSPATNNGSPVETATPPGRDATRTGGGHLGHSPLSLQLIFRLLFLSSASVRYSPFVFVWNWTWRRVFILFILFFFLFLKIVYLDSIVWLVLMDLVYRWIFFYKDEFVSFIRSISIGRWVTDANPPGLIHVACYWFIYLLLVSVRVRRCRRVRICIYLLIYLFSKARNRMKRNRKWCWHITWHGQLWRSISSADDFPVADLI